MHINCYLVKEDTEYTRLGCKGKNTINFVLFAPVHCMPCLFMLFIPYPSFL